MSSMLKKVKITLGMEFLLKLIKTLALKGVNGTLIDKSWRTDLSTPQSTVKILRHFASFFGQEILLKRYCKIFFSSNPKKSPIRSSMQKQ